MNRRRASVTVVIGLVMIGALLCAPGAAQASFGFKDLAATASNEDGTVDSRAGSHPFEYSVTFSLDENGAGVLNGDLKDLFVDLPPGLVGNPLAVPRCTGAEFEGGAPRCPGATQVGIVVIRYAGTQTTEPVYNLAPPLGAPASLGVSLLGSNSFQDASIRSGADYGVTISDLTIPTSLEIRSVTETIWGVPAESSHDSERVCINPNGSLKKDCASDAPLKPFLTLPTSCNGPLQTTVRGDSVQEPGIFQSKTALSLGNAGLPAALNSCERESFGPTIVARPETNDADSPSGLHFNLHIPQTEGREALATAHLKDTVLTLPPGLAVNPSAGNGLGACSQAQIGFERSEEGRTLFTPAPADCPENSKIGSVEISTPLLDHPVKGAIYLAKQIENPFGSLLALYLTANDPLTGVVVKLPGKVELDPVSGQVKATFAQNPQLPFEDLSVDLFGGPRGTLTTPSVCGTYTPTATLTPWSAPEGATVTRSDSFAVSSSPTGGPCAGSESQLPNAPGFEAGTATPIAGAYSPFVLKVSRENGTQRIGSIDATLPKGLVGKAAGLPYCSETQIAAAAARSNPGEGALEQASPSCPQATEIGTVTVGAGSGSPLYVQGHAYWAGPYKGAPLSLAIVTPAVAGPFDLGVVVVRTALYVDEITTQIHAVSDPIPASLQGIPLDIRSIAVDMSRPDFTLNPTNCDAMQVLGSATSTLGSAASLASRFQVGACGALGFKPSIALSLKGGTKRDKHPALKAVVTYPKGSYANIARAAVTLPASEFIDPEHINNPCTRPQFNAGKCPPTSVLGKARAYTPLLDKPLEGPVYFRSNGGERTLPDIVADLNGQIHVVLVGAVDSVGKKGSEVSRIRNTFFSVPDAPVSKFVLELSGGKKKGVLVNSANLCKVPNKAVVKFTAQNGKTANSNPAVKNSC